MEFSQLALVFSVAAVFGIVAKKFKQPILIGYLFAGFLLSALGVIKDHAMMESLGKVGITLLLFLVGLEMNLKEVPTIGKAALFTGLGQITFTFTIALLMGLGIGFSLVQASYLAIAVSFSSTIIIVKLLSEKNALGSLYGKIAIGFLLVQDLVAIIILIFLSGLGGGGMNTLGFAFMAVKALALLFSTYFLSKKILPQIFSKYVDVSQELLFIVSIAWALGVASFVAGPLGFTLEIGGFIAGIALSNLPDHAQIASRTRPLRDFFLTIFFLSLGSSLAIKNISSILFPSALYSTLVFVGNPIIVMIVMGYLRFKKRTSFLASVTVAQISEFSLVVVAMGKSLGHLDGSHVALSVMVAAITMTLSTYVILGAEKIYIKIKDRLRIFERKSTIELSVEKIESLEDHIILVGCFRTGSSLLPLLKERNTPYIIVDFNPEIYKKLTAQKYPVFFGDIADPEILDLIDISKAKLVISTINNVGDNLTLLERAKREKSKTSTVFTALTRNDALRLYEKGADYVIVPDIVAGEHIKHILRTYGMGETIRKIGKRHFDRLIFT